MSFDMRGVVVSGIGEGGVFMGLEWVKRQILEKLGFEPYVGTLNLKLDEGTSGKFQSYITSRRGILIVPEDEKLRVGKCFRVRVERKIEGAVIVPLVANYPEDQVEIIAPENLRKSLRLRDGDEVSIEILEDERIN
jgi:riboflavin kinase